MTDTYEVVRTRVELGFANGEEVHEVLARTTDWDVAMKAFFRAGHILPEGAKDMGIQTAADPKRYDDYPPGRGPRPGRPTLWIRVLKGFDLVIPETAQTPTERLLAEIQKDIDDIPVHDDEAAHMSEDMLRAKVLGLIAEGAPDPDQLAKLALTTKDLDFDRWYA